MSHLANIVSHAQRILAEILLPGDLVVDLTAGNGSDTLFLAGAVGPTGRVLAFDIQQRAIDATAEKLRQAGVSVALADRHGACCINKGVTLVAASHALLSHYLDEPVKGIVANLGYLPGGDSRIVTLAESTVSALKAGMAVLVIGGRLAVVVYPGHPGGDEESLAVGALFKSLSPKQWNVLRIDVPNSASSPYLLVAEKR